jgi:hypothetical protein
MKLIYSLHIGKNRSRNGDFCGYRNKEELLNSLLLSSAISSKHFTGCELYCDTEGAELIKKDGREFPFTNIFICFDELNNWLEPRNWAYAKILAYSLQKEPFIHLDSDAIIWDGVPPQLLKMKFIFQQREVTANREHGFYTQLYNQTKNIGLLPEEASYFPEHAFNMGVFGCLSQAHLPVVKKYFDVVTNYLLKQQSMSGVDFLKYDQSVLFEQLFISNIINNAGLRYETDYDTFISDEHKNKFIPDYSYSHFIASWKRNDAVPQQIKNKLKEMGLEKPVNNEQV